MTQPEPPEPSTVPSADGTLRRYAVDAAASAFALHWVSNLILWYPWSISTTFGLTIMLTVVPALWAFGIAALLLRWPRADMWIGATWTAVAMLTVPLISDLVFVSIVRKASDELVRPTFTAYAWVAALPFLVVAVARRWIGRRRTPVAARDIVTALGVGLAALAVIMVIVTFDLRRTP